MARFKLQSPFPNASPSLALRWLIVIVLSIICGWLFTSLGIPASWILAAILCSGGSALLTKRELILNRYYFLFGRGIIAILAAIPLTKTPPHLLFSYLIPGLLVSCLTIVLGIVGGILLARHRKEISPETGVLSMLPGGASTMPMLAKELKADYRYVMLSQYLRLLIVSVSLPLVTHLLVSTATAENRSRPSVSEIFGLDEFGTSISGWSILLIVIIIMLGGPLAKLLHLPAGAILGPMLLTVVISYFLPASINLNPPTIGKIAGFFAIGWMCGGGLSLDALKRFAKQLPATLAFIVALLLTCATTAWLLVIWIGITPFEAYLATSPGALETVLAISTEGNAGPSVVTTQIIRLVAIMVTGGYLPRILRLILRK